VAGQSTTKTFRSPELAAREHDKLVGEKIRKGSSWRRRLRNPPPALALTGKKIARSSRSPTRSYFVRAWKGYLAGGPSYPVL